MPDENIIPNPRADMPCGPRAGTEHDVLPEPQHHECGACYEAVKEILFVRYRQARTRAPRLVSGELFPDIERGKKRRD